MLLQRIDTNHPLYEPAKELRNAILRRPLGLTLTPEELVLDGAREHYVAVVNGEVVGSISCYLQTPTVLRIKQMAVDPAMQGKGIGAKLMQQAEQHGHALGAQQALLHARCSAQGFYEKRGYGTQGERFMEQGIPHIAMVKPLSPLSA